MRKALLLAAILLCLCLPVWSEAQSCDGCGIGYRPSSVSSSGGTLTGPLLLPNGSNSAPALAFAAETNTGMYKVQAEVVCFAAGSTCAVLYNSSGDLFVRSTGRIGFTNGVASTTPDTTLSRDAANTLALRNAGTAGTPVPQTFNVYKFCDGANCATGAAYGSVRWTGNNLEFSRIYSGTGTSGAMAFVHAGLNTMYYTATGSLYPSVTDTGSVGLDGWLWQSFGVSRSIQGSKSKALTDNTATAFVRLAVADDDYEHCNVIYTAYAEDTATDARQIRAGTVHAAILNNSGTETVAFSTGDSSVVVTAGTFTCTFDGNSGAADTIDLRATCDTSLAATTTLTFEYRLDCPSAVTVTPQ